jgi:phosphoribosylaminoimidazolecarboxamide formyltransferase/IMP cyclohydrolase
MQPGGSKRDDLSVKVCDARGAAMVFSRRRHFLH